MGGRSSSFRAKKSGGGLNKKENAEKSYKWSRFGQYDIL